MRSGLLLLIVFGLTACQPMLVRKTAPVVPVSPQSEFGTIAPGQRITASPTPPTVATIEPPAESPVAPPLPSATTQQVTYTHPDMLFAERQARGPRPEPPIIAAMQAHLDGRYAATVGHLAGFEKRNQELLLLLLPIVDAARTADLNGHDPKLDGLARQLDAASEMVSRVAPLGLRTMTFANCVTKFGVYESLPIGYQFLPGGRAMLYVEVVNAPSVPVIHANKESGFVTRLAGSLELCDANRRIVEQHDPESGRAVNVLPFTQHEFTRSPIRDHFIKIEFPVPEKAGKYTLTLEVKDSDGGRRVRKSIDFDVRGQ